MSESPQLSLFNAPVPPYQAHSPTSREAASSMLESLDACQRRVYQFIALRGRWRGATDEEIQVALEMNPSTERPRRIELCNKGLIENSGRTRKTRSGRKATVWVPTV